MKNGIAWWRLVIGQGGRSQSTPTTTLRRGERLANIRAHVGHDRHVGNSARQVATLGGEKDDEAEEKSGERNGEADEEAVVLLYEGEQREAEERAEVDAPVEPAEVLEDDELTARAHLVGAERPQVGLEQADAHTHEQTRRQNGQRARLAQPRALASASATHRLG